MRARAHACSADPVSPPLLRDADHHHVRRLYSTQKAFLGRLRQHRVGLDSDEPLHGERRVGQQPARVATAAPRIRPRPDEPERTSDSGREPAGQLERSPVVLPTAERDEHAVRVAESRPRAYEHGDVGRRALEERGEMRPACASRDIAGASTSTRSMSCSATSRIASSAGLVVVNTAVRRRCGHGVAPSRLPLHRPARPRRSTMRAMMSSRDESVASGAATATSASRRLAADGSTSTARDGSARRLTESRASESCVRIARSRPRSAGVGSMPNCSTSASRVLR